MSSNDGARGNAVSRRFRTAAVSVMWVTTLAFVSATAVRATAAEVTGDTPDSLTRGVVRAQPNRASESLPPVVLTAVPEAPLEAQANSAELVLTPTVSAINDGAAIDEPAGDDVTPHQVTLVETVDAPGSEAGKAPSAGGSQPSAEPEGPTDTNMPTGLGLRYAAGATGFRSAVDDGPYRQLAQFQLPETKPGLKPAAPPPELTFQYAYGSDSEISYRRNADLNNRVRDNSTIAAPTVFAIATYRPNAWLEATVEMTLERLLAIQEEKQVLLPSGEIQRANKKRFSLLVDQAYLRIHNVIDPFEISVGRKNFEDARLWLYDAALDAVNVKLKQGNLTTDVSVGRENLRDLDLLSTAPRGHTDYYILHSEYRGIEDHRFAAYAITLRNGVVTEGKPLITGVRAYGRPTDKFNYWTEFSLLRGEDPTKIDYRAHAFDVGATYRFTDVPTQPSVTLGYAFGSGDGNPNDRRNREYRQTGLQSNEGRFGGVTQFKTYGETFDPELSNLKIFTLGVGFRPASNAFIDVVYHKYRLDKIGNDLRGSALTALVSQDDTRLSKRVGSEIDLILGFRNLFGYKRFGFEVRAGMFFPGDAYRVEEGNPNNPTFRKADKGVSVLAVFIY